MLLSTQHHAQSVCDLSSSAPRPAGAGIGYIIFKCAGYACGCVYGGPLVPGGQPVDTFFSYIRVVTSPSRTGTDWIGFFSARFRAATVRPSGGDVLLLPLPSHLSRSVSPLSLFSMCVCACVCLSASLLYLWRPAALSLPPKNTIFHQITRCSIPESTLGQILKKRKMTQHIEASLLDSVFSLHPFPLRCLTKSS